MKKRFLTLYVVAGLVAVALSISITLQLQRRPESLIPESWIQADRTVAFGDSYMLWAVRFYNYLPEELHYVGGTTHAEPLSMIKNHPGGKRYKKCVIIGGIADVIVRRKRPEYFRKIRQHIRDEALEKFPRAEIIMPSLEDMVYAHGHYPREGDPLHLSHEGYVWLDSIYPNIGLVRKRGKEGAGRPGPEFRGREKRGCVDAE